MRYYHELKFENHKLKISLQISKINILKPCVLEFKICESLILVHLYTCSVFFYFLVWTLFPHCSSFLFPEFFIIRFESIFPVRRPSTALHIHHQWNIIYSDIKISNINYSIFFSIWQFIQESYWVNETSRCSPPKDLDSYWIIWNSIYQLHSFKQLSNF